MTGGQDRWKRKEYKLKGKLPRKRWGKRERERKKKGREREREVDSKEGVR